MLNPLRGSGLCVFQHLRLHRRLFILKSFGLLITGNPELKIDEVKGFKLNNRGWQPTENEINEAPTLEGLNFFISQWN